MEIIEEKYVQDKDNMSTFKFGSSLNIHSEVILKIIDITKSKMNIRSLKGLYIINTKILSRIHTIKQFCAEYFENWITQLFGCMFLQERLDINVFKALYDYIDSWWNNLKRI